MRTRWSATTPSTTTSAPAPVRPYRWRSSTWETTASPVPEPGPPDQVQAPHPERGTVSPAVPRSRLAVRDPSHLRGSGGSGAAAAGAPAHRGPDFVEPRPGRRLTDSLRRGGKSTELLPERVQDARRWAWGCGV